METVMPDEGVSRCPTPMSLKRCRRLGRRTGTRSRRPSPSRTEVTTKPRAGAQQPAGSGERSPHPSSPAKPNMGRSGGASGIGSDRQGTQKAARPGKGRAAFCYSRLSSSSLLPVSTSRRPGPGIGPGPRRRGMTTPEVVRARCSSSTEAAPLPSCRPGEIPKVEMSLSQWPTEGRP